MKKERILLRLCKMGGREQEYIDLAFRDNWVVPLGPNVDGFEQDLEKFLLPQDSHKKICALSSGTAAIHLGLVMLGVDKGDEVMVQSLTFSASANPVVYQGATPVFVDSEPETWNIDPELLDTSIKDRLEKTGRLPKAIVVVDLYGMPAKLDAITNVAKKWGIPILEDAAEAFGSEYKGEKCGNFGLYGALSFNGNKMITTSGGGALICPDEETRKRVASYATQSREPAPWYQHERIGFNYRMSNICAGIGRGQMMVAQEFINHHKWVQSVYREAFKDIPEIILHENPSPEFDSNFWLSTISISPQAKIKGDDGCGSPEALRRCLEKENIESRQIWKPMHLQPFFKDAPAYLNGCSEKIFNTGLCLPAGPWVGENELERVISTIKSSLQ
ncbi:MAG: aminotransferase class I/II-fold pyridoxal phosphate-dependent enzyme [Muribaculaceae bacterium]|nr:aminotransferase class I/II-fold pyridoxal phosphate-dependent enzyme [Muribaculaceae bacterium]